MGDKTIIAWTNHTFNVAWGCEKVSPGCAHCYADDLAKRYGHSVWGAGQPRRTFGEQHWSEPLAWERAAAKAGARERVFTSSMCDVFEDHPTIARERERLWNIIRTTPNLDWQILTKRSNRIAACLPEDWGGGWPNVWLGVSIEDQERAIRADHLREIPAAIRFVSYEPALGPLTLDLRGIGWVICGGESGAKFRPMDLDWARSMRDQCAAAGVAYFFKQSSARFTERGTTLDGETVRQYPKQRTNASSVASTRRSERPSARVAGPQPQLFA